MFCGILSVGLFYSRRVFMENINEERWISLNEVCKYLGVTRQTVLNWIDKKGLPSAKVGKLWKFKTDEIDEWVRNGGSKSR